MNNKLLRIFKYIGISIIAILYFCIIYSITLHCLYLYKFHNNEERRNNICNRFRNDCFERVKADLLRGDKPVKFDDYNEISKLKCPSNCLWYTEGRGYFANKDKQDKYFQKKVKKCEQRLKKCQEKHRNELFMCGVGCDKYGELVIPYN